MGEKISFIDLFGTELEIEDEYAREQLSGEAAARAEDVAVLSARMDQFTALPDGSTAGDAELTDIRVGADGTVYNSAGAAVRGQAMNLQKDNDGNVTGFIYENNTHPYLYNALEGKPDESYVKRSKNRFNEKYIAGFINQTNGELHEGSTTYSATPDYIEVQSVPFVLWAHASSNIGFRYALYDENKEYITGAILSASDFTDFITPGTTNNHSIYHVFNEPGAKYIRFSILSGIATNPQVWFQVEDGETPTFYEKYHDDTDKVKPVSKNTNSSYSMSWTNVIDEIYIPYNISVRKNKVYHLHTTFSTFDTLYFGHGQESYSLYFKLDNTNITFMTNGTEGTVIPHGLTLSAYIDILLIAGQKTTGKLIINTLNGTFERDVQIVNGYKGYIFVRPENCTLSNCTIEFSSGDFDKDIWLFGDSYFTHSSDLRWPYYALEWGFTNYLLNAFPGENSDEALPQALAYLQNNGTPKYLVWCLGMNDPDTSSAINADWKTCVETLIATCKEKGVTPILATIPNTPTLVHTFKNDYVRNSGYRYIDFAKAVNAENAGASWYTGCLASDNTHPTAEGARLLALQAILDVPEMTY